MNIQPIIVREYLESLKESEELDYIFPILLEAEGFIIFSKPTEYKGFSQYGKDIVAVGIDFHDGIKKKFHFELKGGDDRHISKSNLTKNDGIIESLRESKYAEFKTLNEEYQNLPLKIVLVHNGEIKSSIQKTFEDFIAKEFPLNGGIEFERWGISELTKLFSEKLFSAFLLTDPKTTKLFNRVLINLDVYEKVSQDFIELLDCMFSQIDRYQYKKATPKNYITLFESIRLISFIIYTESKSYNNLSIAKKYLSCLILKYWNWILCNKFENDKKITQYFDKTLKLYFDVLSEFFQRTLSIAVLKAGLYSEQGGRYEEVGYTCRTFEYLQDLCFFLNFIKIKSPDKNEDNKSKQIVVNIINANNVSNRPLLDIHSIPIISILSLFLGTEDNKNAETYLESIFDNLINAKERYDRMPDANNDIKNVIRYITTNEKSMYYIDTTSLLIATLLEFTVILNRNDIFNKVRDFIKKHSIDIALFVPHHGINSSSKQLIENTNFDLEELLFSFKPFNEGYQHNVLMTKNFKDDFKFEDYKEYVLSLKNEFTYEYRTDKAGYSFLRDLAHIYNKTPYFPDKWRIYLQH